VLAAASNLRNAVVWPTEECLGVRPDSERGQTHAINKKFAPTPGNILRSISSDDWFEQGRSAGDR